MDLENVVEIATLYYREGRSDKVYRAAIDRCQSLTRSRCGGTLKQVGNSYV